MATTNPTSDLLYAAVEDLHPITNRLFAASFQTNDPAVIAAAGKLEEATNELFRLCIAAKDAIGVVHS